MTSFDQFKQEWLGRQVDYDHVFEFQCVDLILQYLYECFGIASGVHGNAIDYWVKTGLNGFNQPLLDKFSKVPNSDAEKGDIVVLNGLPGNQFGHIGIATGNINAGDVEILEQNGGNGDGDGQANEGNAVRVRYISRSRVAGLLRPHQPAEAPAPAAPVDVQPYTIERIDPRQVKLNKDVHKWGLNYDNLTAIVNNPEGSIAAGTVITVSAILHHNIGYNYYLEDPNVASGYNVLDCDDYTPPVPYNPAPTSAAGALHPSNADETYQVIVDIPGYISSNQAINHVNPKVTIPVGTYFVFNKRLPAVNVTKTPGTPGAWINPADNVIAPPEPEVVPEPEPAPEVEAAPVEEAPALPSFADTYKAFDKPELYVAMKALVATDMEGKRKNATMPQYSVTWVTGSFTVDGIEYARPKSATDKDWWFGIPWVDQATNLVNLELESDVFNDKTTLAERQATHTLRFTDRFVLALAHFQNYYLGFTHFLSKIKLSNTKINKD